MAKTITAAALRKGRGGLLFEMWWNYRVTVGDCASLDIRFYTSAAKAQHSNRNEKAQFPRQVPPHFKGGKN